MFKVIPDPCGLSILPWLWRGHIPARGVTVIAGDRGGSHLAVACDIAARATAGNPWPGEADSREPRTVLIPAHDGLFAPYGDPGPDASLEWCGLFGGANKSLKAAKPLAANLSFQVGQGPWDVNGWAAELSRDLGGFSPSLGMVLIPLTGQFFTPAGPIPVEDRDYILRMLRSWSFAKGIPVLVAVDMDAGWARPRTAEEIHRDAMRSYLPGAVDAILAIGANTKDGRKTRRGWLRLPP